MSESVERPTATEPLCRCGHNKAAHEYEYLPKGHCSQGGTNGVPICRCRRFAPAPPSLPNPTTDRDAERPLTDRRDDLIDKAMDVLAESLFCCPKSELKGAQYSDVFDAASTLADLMGDGLADAWDEGISNGDCECGHGSGCRLQTAINPYRAIADAPEGDR